MTHKNREPIRYAATQLLPALRSFIDTSHSVQVRRTGNGSLQISAVLCIDRPAARDLAARNASRVLYRVG